MLSLEIITPEKNVYTGTAQEVILPTQDGILGIRTGHQPLIAPLRAGEVIVRNQNQEDQYLAVAGGFVEVLPESIHILADSAVHSEELDEQAITEAIARAEQLKLESQDDYHLTEASALLEMNLARLKVFQRKRRHGSKPTSPPSSN